ncbi:MAG TPA: AAA family ATPase, partial [Thermomicrobiales bacterium]|nr:AAA family ATPase [Thermomicrobiales bacterium]
MPYDTEMAAQILVTKLYVPRPRPRAVTRPRLVARLNDGLHNKITLISAPPGFGKTSLLSEWVAGCDRPVAWLSLDEADSDPARFLEYLIAALRTVAPQVGEGALRAFQSSQPPQVESILIALLNDIAALPNPLLLVLDDYHLVDAEPVDQAVAFLLDHMASQIHLAIATREDPRLPLARMRARGQMTEVRAADLRFGSTETASFLNEAMGLQLRASDITALEMRTEGWIAGLQLAALSIQGRDDVSGFIRDFAGGDRHIVDYLAEEVLQRQPEPVRAFLLQTSVLDRLNGSLCDAVTGRDDSRQLLESLERGNLFLVALDDTRLWYRYHHLFAEVLRAFAMEHPDQVAAQHRRASEWYARHDLPAEAVRHALAAGDVARAADLIELAAPATRRDRQEAMLLGWLRALPDLVFRSRPVLSALHAGALLSSGQVEGVED